MNTGDGVLRELKGFARVHGLVLPNEDCLSRHVSRYLELGHCPCVETRRQCPCEESLADVERIGRCECGILVDPARMCMLRDQRHSSSIRCGVGGGTKMVAIERLKEVGIFQGISDAELTMIQESVVRVQSFKQGEQVFAENAESSEMYVVDSGRVNLEIEAIPDTRLQVASFKRNEVFGWEALVPPYKYTSTAKAVADSSLVVLDGAGMRNLCRTYPDICARVMERVVRIAADQLAATRQQMCMLRDLRSDSSTHSGTGGEPKVVTIERLKEVGIFQGISDAELKMIQESVARVQSYPQGTQIFTENSESSEMYVVDSGRVNLEIEAIPETRLQVASLQRNGVFGWEALVPPYKYTSTSKAVADSSLVVLDGAGMRNLCKTYPDICARVMERVVRIAADQLAATRQQMFMLLHSK